MINPLLLTHLIWVKFNSLGLSNAYMDQWTNHHWFRQWRIIWLAPSYCLNQCWNIVNWILKNKLQWNFNRNSCIFIQENAFENAISKMMAILSQPQCVNSFGQVTWYGSTRPLPEPMMSFCLWDLQKNKYIWENWMNIWWVQWGNTKSFISKIAHETMVNNGMHSGLSLDVLKMASWTHMGRTANIIIKDVIHIFASISLDSIFCWWDGVIVSAGTVCLSIFL